MKRKRRPFRIVIGCASVAILLIVLLGLLLYRGTQHVPDWYDQALVPEDSPQQQVELGDAFEREALDLHNQVQRQGGWEAVFNDAEVNAWLANDLPQNHPHALPPDVGQPRVKIAPEQIQLACAYNGEPFPVVVSLSADVYLTDKPNQLAIRIQSVRAGLVPLPLKNLLDQVTDVARRSGLQLVWSQQDGDPVALLQIPSKIDNRTEQQLHVERLELRDGEVYVAGHTDGSDRSGADAVTPAAGGDPLPLTPPDASD